MSTDAQEFQAGPFQNHVAAYLQPCFPLAFPGIFNTAMLMMVPAMLPPSPSPSSPYPPMVQSIAHNSDFAEASATTIRSNSYSGYGLHQLADHDSVRVEQQVERFELLSGFEQENVYKIKSPDGTNLFTAVEKSDTLERITIGKNRALTIEIYPEGSAMIEPVVVVKRPFRLVSKYVEICDGQRRVMGKTRKQFHVKGKMQVLGAKEEPLYSVETAVGDIVLKHKWRIVDARTDEKVGKVTKRWAGFLQELYTDADNFEIQFPPNADAVARGLLLATVLFIDLSHFERSDRPPRARAGFTAF